MNRYGSCAYAVDQQFSLYDAASDDQKFKLVTVNNKQRIAMNGNTSLGLNVYRSGDNPCTLYTLLNNDNDSQVSIEACSEGVSDCYYIYLTAHGKSVYTLTAPTNLTSTSARVTWKPYTGSPEQIWKIKTSHTANTYSGHGRYLPSRQDSTVTPFIWPCYKKNRVSRLQSIHSALRNRQGFVLPMLRSEKCSWRSNLSDLRRNSCQGL